MCACGRVCNCMCTESKVKDYIFAHRDRKKSGKSLASQHIIHIYIPSSSLSLFFDSENIVCLCMLLSSCVSVSAFVKQHFMHVYINHWTTISMEKQFISMVHSL